MVADALGCGLNGRHLSLLNRLHATIGVTPVLLTTWPETGKQQAERMFVMPSRVVSYDAYASGVEDLFRGMVRPFVAVFRESRVVSVFGNMNSDIAIGSLFAHLRSLGVLAREDQHRDLGGNGGIGAKNEARSSPLTQ